VRISKAAAAAVSVTYNVVLIAAKLVAAIVTGSVALLSEALNSTIDLVASVIAFVAVRRADVPADREHPYGHQKIESVAATIEGMLIISVAGFIIFESIGRLVSGDTAIDSVGVGIVVIAFSAASAAAVGVFLRRQARAHSSPALEGDAAHLSADAITSFGVLLGLVAVEVTGAEWVDAAVAIALSAFIIYTGVNIIRKAAGTLVDEALPADEMDRIEAAIGRVRPPEMVGYHRLRARTAGTRRYVEMHVQFRDGTTLEQAHALAHDLRDAIERDLRDAEVLIHVEPESSRRDPASEPEHYRAG
jgi:cation diffusion facilitator family transporter